MVKIGFKKTLLVILILSFSLSLIPNFLYNEDRVLAACPAGCTSKIEDGETYCINCPIACPGSSFTNKSCLPLEGTGEWTLGREIPIGEIIDRSSFLASKMLAEFGGMIKAGEEMTKTADQLLTNLPSFSCGMNASDCYKYLSFSGWGLTEGPADQCNEGPRPPDRKECGGREPCESCAEQSRDWEITFAPDPEYPEDTITCSYRRPEGTCGANCTLFRCGGYRGFPGCCSQYFDPAISSYSNIERALSDLKNDINETNAPEKFKRSYILDQLNFSRCELAQCWIPAEDFPDVLTGDKVGKYLFSCKTVSDMDLFEDDQLTCLTLQAANEWEEIQARWANPENWWDRPVVIFKIYATAYTLPWRIYIITWQMIWGMIQEWFDVAQEEGCYPTNYYCGQM